MFYSIYKINLELVYGGEDSNRKELYFVIPVRDFQIFLLEITINLDQNIASFYLVQTDDPQILYSSILSP